MLSTLNTEEGFFKNTRVAQKVDPQMVAQVSRTWGNPWVGLAVREVKAAFRALSIQASLFLRLRMRKQCYLSSTFSFTLFFSCFLCSCVSNISKSDSNGWGFLYKDVAFLVWPCTNFSQSYLIFQISGMTMQNLLLLILT